MHILPALHCKQANEYSDDWNSLDASLHSCGRVAREYTPPFARRASCAVPCCKKREGRRRGAGNLKKMEEKSGSEMQAAVNEARTWIEVSASTTSTNAVMMKPSLVSPPSQNTHIYNNTGSDWENS